MIKQKRADFYQLALKLAAMAITLYGLSTLFLFLFQHQLLYHPSPVIQHNYPTRQLTTEQQRLNLIVVNPGQRKAVLYFGGNAESAARQVQNLAPYFKQQTLYLLDYRGYGDSTGSPGEQALYHDAQFVYDTIQSEHQHLAVIGRSLGSGIAVRLAAIRPIQHLVLITPYDSILNVARQHYPLFPIQWMLKDQYNIMPYASQVSADTLIILSQQDNIIPHHHARQLAEALPPERTRTIIIPDSNHNTVTDKPQTLTAIRDFLNDTSQSAPGD